MHFLSFMFKKKNLNEQSRKKELGKLLKKKLKKLRLHSFSKRKAARGHCRTVERSHEMKLYRVRFI